MPHGLGDELHDGSGEVRFPMGGVERMAVWIVMGRWG